MIAHSTLNEGAIAQSLLNFIWNLAEVGMTLFFVLSGFVIHYNYRHTVTEHGGLVRFAKARIARLYPFYFMVFAWDVYNSPAVIGMLSGDRPEGVASFLFSASLTQAWWYAKVDGADLIYRWGLSTSTAWSVSVELMLYLLYPLCCIAVARVRRPGTNIALLTLALIAQTVIGCWAVASRDSIFHAYEAVFGHVTGGSDLFSHWVEVFSPFTRIWTFAFGVVLANMFVQRHDSDAVSKFTAPGIALLAIVAFNAFNSFYINPHESELMGGFNSMHPMLFRTILTALAGVSIYSASVNRASPASRILGHPWMVNLGNATYASYLLHVTFFNYVNSRIISLVIAGATWREATIRLGAWVVTYVVLMAVSYAIFRLIETPSRRWLSRHLSDGAVSTILAAQVAMFVAGVLYVSIHAR